MSGPEKSDPPKKRYSTTIRIDHHNIDDLLSELNFILINHAVEWGGAGNQPPYSLSIGGTRIIEHVEHEDGYELEDDYRKALGEWAEAQRTIKKEGDPS